MLINNLALVIKPTYRCNYSCEFCSTVGDDAITLKIEELIDFINRLSKNYSLTAIMSGGEPTIVGTDYYKKLFETPLESISIQSNGEIPYLQFEKWRPILEDKRVDMGISFQLGNQRKSKKGVVFTKELFLKYQDFFKSRLGDYLFFIYVLTNDNCTFEKIDELIEMTSHLDKGFRISAAFKSGRGEDVYLPLYRSIRIFNYILEKYPRAAFAISPLNNFVLSDAPLSKCNYTPNCKIGMVSIEPDGQLYSCCGLGDRYSDKSLGHISDSIESIKQKVIELDLSHQIRKECSDCHNKNFCNSCYIRYLDVIEDSLEELDLYCEEMKKLHSNIGKLRSTIGLNPDIIEVYEKNIKEYENAGLFQTV